MERTLSIDLETYSEIDIAKCGSFRYIDDESFEILLLGYAFDDEPVTVIDLTADEEVPADFLAALYDSEVTKTAWNCAFERFGLWKHFGRYCPPEQWSDTMILSAVCGLPLGLGEAGKALRLEADEAKDREGKALIRYFCSPCRPTKVNGGRTRNLPTDAPDKWAQFIEYNRQDVVAERTIRKRLLRWEPDSLEHRFWCLDARINERGMRVDRGLVHNAIAMDARYKAELTKQAVAISGLENPNSVAQIKQWLLEQEGIEVPSLNKKVVAEVVSQLNGERAKQFMALRTRLAKSSTKKYEAMERSACADAHIKGCFQFYGANRTGRFAGRLVQLQNLPQNHMEDLAVARSLVRDNDYETVRLLYDSVSDTLSELIRTALIPEPGHRFIVADFSAIEARVIAWIAGEQWRLDVFRNGGDIYCASASQMFHVPVVKHGENGHLRQKGKIAELALGYGGGANALKAFGADKMGMTEEEMVNTVDLWREASPRVCALWRALERAAIRCVAHKTPQVSAIGGIRFEMECGILWMTLPSGRRIAYYGAEYGPSRFHRDRRALSYMGVDQKTKRWGRVETWGGKLAENVTQATARDCLRDTMLALEDAGYDIRAHVHDEVIISEPRDGRTVEDVSAIMGRELPWATGLPLRGDGYACDFYMKD
jgi:DNA polymerase